MHVSSNYHPGNDPNATLYANYTMFHNAIGNHADRLKNLHFVYALTVRALNLVHDQLIQHEYRSGMCMDKDELTSNYIIELLTHTIGECAI